MMSSDTPENGAQVLDTLLALLDGDQVRRSVDEPLQQAVSSFGECGEEVASQHAFLEMAGNFIAHVYAKGLRLPQRLTHGQAKAEALYLLEVGYVGAYDRGYDAALTDAVGSAGGGVDSVLAALGDIVRIRERGKYLDGVLRGFLDPLDWQTQALLATQLMARLQNILPPNIVQYSAERWADEWPCLLNLVLDADGSLGELVGGALGGLME